MKKQTICLNMIVKNEKHVIERCLDAVMPLIDTWVIVDTGSTDGTQEIIRKHLKKIPGELYERPWVNFGHNRDEAMRLARGKGDYLLFVDADDEIVVEKNFTLPPLDKELYSILQKEGQGATYREHQVYFLIKNNLDFSWKGVIHEYLSCPTDKTRELLTGIYCRYINDGDRSKDPNKCFRDIEILKKAALENPSDSRSIFYLARTYWSIRDIANAVYWFERRIPLGGDPMEVYHSLLYIAIMQKMVGSRPQMFLQCFERAHLFRPSRAEAIYEIGRHFVEEKNYLIAYSILKSAEAIPPSTDNLFVETWVWKWGIPLQLFLCAKNMGLWKEAERLSDRLNHEPSFPEEVRKEFNIASSKSFAH